MNDLAAGVELNEFDGSLLSTVGGMAGRAVWYVDVCNGKHRRRRDG